MNPKEAICKDEDRYYLCMGSDTELSEGDDADDEALEYNDEDTSAWDRCRFPLLRTCGPCMSLCWFLCVLLATVALAGVLLSTHVIQPAGLDENKIFTGYLWPTTLYICIISIALTLVLITRWCISKHSGRARTDSCLVGSLNCITALCQFCCGTDTDCEHDPPSPTRRKASRMRSRRHRFKNVLRTHVAPSTRSCTFGSSAGSSRWPVGRAARPGDPHKESGGGAMPQTYV